jgi:NAD(P)-dependent dehydrogenase (short-subunit alcohol dehydrogenase family)
VRRAARAAPVHEIRWEADAGPVPRWRDRAGRWILCADRRGVATRLAALLEAKGEACELFPLPEPRLASDPAAVRALVRDALGRDGLRVLGVVYLWALDAPEPEQGASRAAEEACAGLLHVTQALVADAGDEPPRLWLVTAGAQPVGGAREEVALTAAAVWGLGRVIAAEHPELRFAAVDLPAVDPGREVEALARLLRSEHPGEQLGLRGGVEHTPRLVTITPPAGGGRLMAEATYLITGGAGALGLATARWMVEAGARHLVLVGRSPPGADAEHAVARLRAAGARVVFHQVDVASAAGLASVFADLDAHLPPLRGVVHAAGALDDALVPEVCADRLGRVLAPKIDGAFHLDRLTAHRPLDFFVVYSSIASWLGLAGEASYAAANASLEALAQRRRARGLPALSIGWGSFTGTGLAATPGGRRVAAFLARRGVGGFSVDAGMATLGALLAAGAAAPARVLVMPVAAAPAEGGPSRWDALLGRARPAPEDRGIRLREALAAAHPASRRRALLAAHLVGEVASVLGLPVEGVDAEAPMRALGMDSLMAIELRDRLEASLGIPVATTLVWQRPTVSEMAAYLAERLDPERDEPAAPPAREPAPAGAPDDLDALLAEVEQLSDEAAREKLAADRGLALR